MNDGLAVEDKRTLLRLAREALAAEVRGKGAAPAAGAGLPAALTRLGCCFVTLTMNGKLRGCIGGLRAERPLYEDVSLRAGQAAQRDYRFPPVSVDELDQIEIEVSVLTTPIPLPYAEPAALPGRLRPGVDGVILRRGTQEATFLPQVWEHAPEPERFLALLCEKLGLTPDAWRETRLEAWVYEAVKFTEAEFGLGSVGKPHFGPTD